MKAHVIRHLSGFVGGLLKHVYPKSQSVWVRAMRCEIEQVDGEGAALIFALGCLWGGFREAAIQRLPTTLKGVVLMIASLSKLRQPRNTGIVCALAATCLGIAYLVAAGAPPRYPVVNAVAFLLGIVALGGIAGAELQTRRFTSHVLVVLGGCLLATALLGAPVDGASRWLWIGPLSVQVSLVILPLMIIAFARHPDALGTLGMVVAAGALALQPDRAMAGVLAFGMAVLAMTRPGRFSAAALLAATAAFVICLLRPDTLPAVPYVDRILFTAFDVHVLAGAAVLLGSLLLLIPSIIGWHGDPARAHVYWVFGAVWMGCVLAAALGNYPTPVVGYGGSVILGYLLTLSFLPTEVPVTENLRIGAADDDVDQLGGLSRRTLPA